tara:strand:- start:58 stop:735 length:678 start_codon:yes stop_codon:yes gene_type:complete
MNNEFKQNKYQVIKQAISYDLANFCFNYLLLKRDAANFMYSNNIIADTGMWGTWKDAQVPGVYSHYADPVMETLLMKVLPVMKEQTGLDLIPTYSYTRVYTKGSILWRHKDRPSCEISTTLNLGGDMWPIYIDPTGQNNILKSQYTDKGEECIVKKGAHPGNRVDLEPGDMLVYSGCELEHWRNEFTGDICAQVFLHYNHRNGPFAEKNKFDNRPLLGIPSFVKN